METERKFLVKQLPLNYTGYPKKNITQGYIAVSPAIRVRSINGEYYLTVKCGTGIVKEEFETAISKEQYTQLIEKAETRIIEKERYYIPVDDTLTAELDVYKGNLNGFLTVEVEFLNLEDALSFTPPDWFGQDVSHDSAYSNASLCTHGIPKINQ